MSQAEDLDANVDQAIATLEAFAARLRSPTSGLMMQLMPYMLSPAQRQRFIAAVEGLMSALEAWQVALHRDVGEG